MYTFDLEINGRVVAGGKYETLAEAEDRFCTFMCNKFDHYSETRNRKTDGIFGSIMNGSKCVGGYDIYRTDED